MLQNEVNHFIMSRIKVNSHEVKRILEAATKMKIKINQTKHRWRKVIKKRSDKIIVLKIKELLKEMLKIKPNIIYTWGDSYSKIASKSLKII